MLFGGLVVRRYLDMARPRPGVINQHVSYIDNGGKRLPREAPVTMIVLGAIFVHELTEK